MSVIITKSDPEYESVSKRNCGHCMNKVGHLPILHYNDITICRACIGKIKNGLIADIIHAAAVVEIQDAAGYDDCTLDRKSIAQLVKDAAEERRRDKDYMRKLGFDEDHIRKFG
jgi:hypothetical protein